MELGARIGARLWQYRLEPRHRARLDGALSEIGYYWNLQQSRIVPKVDLEYVRATTGTLQELGGPDPVTASGATLARARLMVGAEIGYYWIFDQKVLDLSAYGKAVDNFSQNFSSLVVSLGPQTITVAPTPARPPRSR